MINGLSFYRTCSGINQIWVVAKKCFFQLQSHCYMEHAQNFSIIALPLHLINQLLGGVSLFIMTRDLIWLLIVFKDLCVLQNLEIPVGTHFHQLSLAGCYFQTFLMITPNPSGCDLLNNQKSTNNQNKPLANKRRI